MNKINSHGFSAHALFFTAVILILPGCASFQNINDILTKKDRKLLVEATQNVLEKNKTGKGSNWSNPETNVRGTVTPVETYERKPGPPCRDYKLTVTFKGKTHEALDTACRQEVGSWKSVNYPGLAGSRIFDQDEYTEPAPYQRSHNPNPQIHLGFGYHHFN